MKIYAIGENKCLVETYGKEELDNKLNGKKILTLEKYLSLSTSEVSIEYELDDSWFDEDGFLNYYLAGGWVSALMFPDEPFSQGDEPPYYGDANDVVEVDYMDNNRLRVICHSGYPGGKHVVCRLVFNRIK